MDTNEQTFSSYIVGNECIVLIYLRSIGDVYSYNFVFIYLFDPAGSARLAIEHLLMYCSCYLLAS